MKIKGLRLSKVFLFGLMITVCLGLATISAEAFDEPGDFTVGGKVGIGTDTPTKPLDVVGGAKFTSTSDGSYSANPFGATALWYGGDQARGRALGGRYNIFLSGSDTQGNATIPSNEYVSQETTMYYGRSDKTDTYNFTTSDTIGLSTLHQRAGNNKRNMNFTNMYGYKSSNSAGTGSSGGRVFTSNFYNAYFEPFKYVSGVWEADNIYGLLIQGNYGEGTRNAGIWVGKSVNATENYGIVLDGDGEGADIVFGANQESKIYGQSGNLVIDANIMIPKENSIMLGTTIGGGYGEQIRNSSGIDGNYGISFITGFTESMRIIAGNVGIGTTDPGTYKLYVNGTAYVTGISQSSDAKFKKNITPINSALDKVMNLKGVSYEWKKDEYKDRGFEDGRHYGVIAQEVETVLPEIVKENGDGYKGVAYTEMIPVMIEAMKEQQRIIEKLESKIRRLESRDVTARAFPQAY